MRAAGSGPGRHFARVELAGACVMAGSTARGLQRSAAASATRRAQVAAARGADRAESRRRRPRHDYRAPASERPQSHRPTRAARTEPRGRYTELPQPPS